MNVGRAYFLTTLTGTNHKCSMQSDRRTDKVLTDLSMKHNNNNNVGLVKTFIYLIFNVPNQKRMPFAATINSYFGLFFKTELTPQQKNSTKKKKTRQENKNEKRKDIRKGKKCYPCCLFTSV